MRGRCEVKLRVMFLIWRSFSTDRFEGRTRVHFAHCRIISRLQIRLPDHVAWELASRLCYYVLIIIIIGKAYSYPLIFELRNNNPSCPVQEWLIFALATGDNLTSKKMLLPFRTFCCEESHDTAENVVYVYVCELVGT